MKTFRFLGMVLFTVLMSVSFAACGDDEDDCSECSHPSEMIGMWEQTWESGYEFIDGVKDNFDEAVSGMFIYFDEDGTGYTYESYLPEEKGEFTWGVKGDKLTIRYMGGSDTVKILSLSSAKMIVEDKGSDYMYIQTFEKRK